ncbi:hypothetical protein HYT55_03130 [Candidatus Woesearchaeota archaeon]|nr:hypothetical protein [Candidatus Woesearchaeota archaeon]
MRPLIIFFILISLIFLIGCSSNSTKYDYFASCLTEKGVAMYGAFWCSHCKDQKEMFGSSFQYINYVECSLPDGSTQTEYCVKKEIKGYPTWELENGTRLEGTVSLEDLSQKTGCLMQ